MRVYVEAEMPVAIDSWGQEMAAFCARRLGIKTPRVRWFKEPAYEKKDWAAFTSKEPIAGRAQRLSNEIWVLAARPLPDMLRTIAHECRHLWQIPKASPDEREWCKQNELAEIDACVWAAEIVALPEEMRRPGSVRAVA